jgi:hypothetical protein
MSMEPSGTIQGWQLGDLDHALLKLLRRHASLVAQDRKRVAVVLEVTITA